MNRQSYPITLKRLNGLLDKSISYDETIGE